MNSTKELRNNVVTDLVLFFSYLLPISFVVCVHVRFDLWRQTRCGREMMAALFLDTWRILSATTSSVNFNNSATKILNNYLSKLE
jgi:hypothetical protein